MQDAVKLTEVEQTLSGLVSLETLMLGIDDDVRLRWCNIIVTLFTSALVQGMIVTSVTWCLCVCK